MKRTLAQWAEDIYNNRIALVFPATDDLVDDLREASAELEAVHSVPIPLSMDEGEQELLSPFRAEIERLKAELETEKAENARFSWQYRILSDTLDDKDKLINEANRRAESAEALANEQSETIERLRLALEESQDAARTEVNNLKMEAEEYRAALVQFSSQSGNWIVDDAGCAHEWSSKIEEPWRIADDVLEAEK